MVVNCPSCQKPLATKPVHAGRTIRCPACRGAVPVPLDLPEDAEDAPPAAPVPVVPKNAFDFDSPGPAATKRANRDEEEDDEDEDKPRYKRADETPPQWLLAAAAFPILLLAILGGIIGGVCGAFAAALNAVVARQRGIPIPVKLGIFAATTAVAFGINVALVMFILAGLKENAADRQNPNGSQIVFDKPVPWQPQPPAPAGKKPADAPEKPAPKAWPTDVTDLPASAPMPLAEAPTGANAKSPLHQLLANTRVRLPGATADATAGTSSTRSS